MREGDDVFPPLRTVCAAASVRVNGAPHPWRCGLTVAAVLDERGTDEGAVATAVNGRFVPRTGRTDSPLCPGDELVVFAAIVGG